MVTKRNRSVQNSIPRYTNKFHKKINNFLNKKEEGYVFLFGIILIVFMLIMMVLIIKKVSISTQTKTIEDAITSSALGCMTVDASRFAISGDIVLDDVDKSYDSLCELSCENLGLTRTPTKSKFSGASEVFNTKGDEFLIKRAIFYNVFSDGSIDIYEYGDSGHLVNTSHGNISTTKTPKNEDITYTSCYVEIQYPVSLMVGVKSSDLFDKTVLKGEYVSLKKRN